MESDDDEKAQEIADKIIQQIQTDDTFASSFRKNPEKTINEIIQKEASVGANERSADLLSLKSFKSIQDKITEISPEDIKKAVSKVFDFLDQDELKKDIGETSKNIRTACNEAKSMLKTLFWFGIGFLIIALALDIFGIVTRTNWQIYVASTGILGSIGAPAIYASTISMYKKVIKTESDYLQLKTSYFSYLQQMSILKRTKFISMNEKIKVTEQIDKITTSLMSNIQKYCEEKTDKGD